MPDQEDRKRQVRQVTWVGMAVNIALSVVKFVIGFMAGSQAIVADGFHSLSDCASDVVILVGVHYWTKPADEDHPHGHQRVEQLAEIMVGFMLAIVAVGLVYNALRQIQVRQESQASSWAALAALIAIVAKEILYRWTAARGKRLKSPAVIANAWHHRSDALSSIPAGLAVAATAIGPQWGFLDPVGALVVSLFILHAAARIVQPAVERLLDRAAPEESRQAIQDIAESVEGVCEAHAIRTRYMGSGIQTDLHVLVDGNIPVRQGHDIATQVKRRLLDSHLDIVDAVVHTEPCAAGHIRASGNSADRKTGALSP